MKEAPCIHCGDMLSGAAALVADDPKDHGERIRRPNPLPDVATRDMGSGGYAAHPGHFMEVCREHGTVLAQCRCIGPKTKQAVACPGSPPCPLPMISQGPVPALRVRACYGQGGPDGGLYVHLRDLMAYVAYPGHDLSPAARDAVEGLLQQLGEGLEND